jgi:capsular exopolysaccharide synthesis family protein
MSATELQAQELDRISVSFKFLQNEADIKRRTYAGIIDRLNEASITSQMENVSIRIFDQAWVPSSPTSAHLGPRTTMAAGAGLLLLLAVPLGLGFLDSRIKSTSQIEISLGEHLLGILPRIKKLNESERSQAFMGNKDDRVVEAYRGLYGEVEIGSEIAYPKSILVTSSVPGEGKSLVASNLAATFASHGRRTLLVDCDLRRPTLFRYFQVEGEPGWVQWLSLPEKERPALPTGIVNISERMDLLPAGGAPKQSTQIIEQLSKAETQSLLLAHYDLVIFDTPPTTVFPDALLLARSCHELLYVCRHGMVGVSVVRRALTHLRGTGVRILGIVLNCAPDSANLSDGYYGYGTRASKYYKAYSDQNRDA